MQNLHSFSLRSAFLLVTALPAPAQLTHRLAVQNTSPGQVNWHDTFVWDIGVPGVGSKAEVAAAVDEEEHYLASLGVEVTIATTIGNLDQDFNTFLIVKNTNFLVSGTTEAKYIAGSPSAGIVVPHFFVGGGTASLGNLVGQSTGTVRTLDTNYSFAVGTVDGGTPIAGNAASVLEWNGAIIQNLQGGSIVMSGPNAVVRDAHGPGGNNALQALHTIGPRGLLSLNKHGLRVANNLENNGRIFFEDAARLTVPGDLTGTGTITNRGGARSTLNVDGTLIRVDTVLDLSPPLLTNPNEGLEVKATGGVNLTNSTVRGSGLIQSTVTARTTIFDGGSGGGRLQITGPLALTNGCINAHGVDSFQLWALTQFHTTTKAAGNVTLRGLIDWRNGSIHPGNSPGAFRVEQGNLTLREAVELDMEIGGLTPATQHDVITQSGGPDGTTLSGILKLTLINGFECLIKNSDTFTILTSDRPLMGALNNVANGARLTTTDGTGSFLVRYGAGTVAPNHVVLSDFQPVIVPETYSQWTTRLGIPAGQTGPNDDPNGDGIVNVVAYATGISPVGPGGKSPFTAEQTPAGVIVSFLAPKSALGLVVNSALSPDLIAWSPGPVLTAMPATALKNRYSFTLPLTGSGRRFGRFNISVTP